MVSFRLKTRNKLSYKLSCLILKYTFKMRDHEKQYIKNWEQKLSKGKWTYLILTSLVWGTLIPFTYYIFMEIKVQNLSAEHFETIFSDLNYIVFWIKWIILSFLIAAIFWKLSKRKYQSLKFKQQKEKTNRPNNSTTD